MEEHYTQKNGAVVEGEVALTMCSQISFKNSTLHLTQPYPIFKSIISVFVALNRSQPLLFIISSLPSISSVMLSILITSSYGKYLRYPMQSLSFFYKVQFWLHQHLGFEAKTMLESTGHINFVLVCTVTSLTKGLHPNNRTLLFYLSELFYFYVVHFKVLITILQTSQKQTIYQKKKQKQIIKTTLIIQSNKPQNQNYKTTHF
eukprot:TRINITY_DN2403_c0_g1_i3.p2 TRINITY_DN2403_c0_g1~~TRINITY_DN2403_c0_g1_i3.p2  ORF type:complete len:203 (-),score=-8.86 TRINITY_DN2403_c0_g1_i3:303-911(-)